MKPPTQKAVQGAVRRPVTKGKPGARNSTVSQRVFLVDDHPITLAGMRQLIESEPGLVICGTAPTAEEGFGLIQKLSPDLVITDLTLPGRNGMELVKDLQAWRPELPVLVVTMHDELLYAERALRAGARGFLMKESSIERLLEAMARVLRGEIYVSERMSGQILSAFGPRAAKQPRQAPSIKSLSDREFEVFQWIGKGQTTREVAERLHISIKTVEVHRAHIKEKLGIATATGLVSHAVRWVQSQE